MIINVSGTPDLSAQNMTVNGIQNTAGQMVASKVLFNFYEDYGTLTLPNVMGGSVWLLSQHGRRCWRRLPATDNA